MGIENKIRKALVARGLSKAEADKEALNYIWAISKGEVEPETAKSLGLTREEIKALVK